MSLEQNIQAIERALGRPLTEARKLACQITDAQNTAYQVPPAASTRHSFRRRRCSVRLWFRRRT